MDRLDQYGRHEAAAGKSGHPRERHRAQQAHGCDERGVHQHSRPENVASDGATPSEVSTCTSQTTAALLQVG
jgi:hypothetical protein